MLPISCKGTERAHADCIIAVLSAIPMLKAVWQAVRVKVGR